MKTCKLKTFGLVVKFHPPSNNQNLVVQTYSIFREVGRKIQERNFQKPLVSVHVSSNSPDWDLCMFSSIAELSFVHIYSFCTENNSRQVRICTSGQLFAFSAVGIQRINNFLSNSVIAQSLDKIKSCLTDSRAALPLNKCESFAYASALLPPRRSSRSGPCAPVQCFPFMADCLNSAAETCVALLVQHDRSQRAAEVMCHFDDFILFDSQLFKAAAQKSF